MTERFLRTEMLLGPEAFAVLQASCVAVTGLGAVGSYAVEGLARSGIGHLRLIDFDTVQPSNINRQLIALESTIGRPKVDVAAERVRDINPACRVEALRLFVDADTSGHVLAPPADAVLDAIDSLNSKVNLLAACARSSVFTLSSMGAATRIDPSRIRVGDLSATTGCPLARLIRKRLRRRGITDGIRCVFSDEPPRRPRPHPASPPAGHEATTTRGRPRSPLPSFSCLTGIFGLMAAREIILELLRRAGRPLDETRAPS